MSSTSKLDSASAKRLNDALLDAFRTWNDLARMVRFGLGESLEKIVKPDDLITVVFKLIEWTESRGRLDELVTAAKSANSGNEKLRDLVLTFVATTPSAAAPAVTPTISSRGLRNLINEINRSDSDFNAFCLDFFRPVHARFGNGMDRVAKVDLLLQGVDAAEILVALRDCYPETFDRLAARHLGSAAPAAAAPVVASNTFSAAAPPAIAPAPPPAAPPRASPAPGAPPLSDPALPELLRAYAGDNLIVFAGAGISAAAGLPSWKRLVELLAERAKSRSAPVAALDEIADLLGKERFIDALSAAKECLGPDFGVVIDQNLDDRALKVPDVASAIAGLAPHLRAVLTTNIDHLLERAFAGAWPAMAHATGDIAQGRQYILKLHGTRLDRASWVFTRDEYDRAMYADPKLQAAFSALFHACPILFVGYGLADDDFDQVLARVRALTGGQAPRHFALVAQATITPNRQRRLENAGVRLIPYANADGKHAEVAAVLRWLSVSA